MSEAEAALRFLAKQTCLPAGWPCSSPTAPSSQALTSSEGEACHSLRLLAVLGSGETRQKKPQFFY